MQYNFEKIEVYITRYFGNFGRIGFSNMPVFERVTREEIKNGEVVLLTRVQQKYVSRYMGIKNGQPSLLKSKSGEEVIQSYIKNVANIIYTLPRGKEGRIGREVSSEELNNSILIIVEPTREGIAHRKKQDRKISRKR